MNNDNDNEYWQHIMHSPPYTLCVKTSYKAWENAAQIQEQSGLEIETGLMTSNLPYFKCNW